MKVNHFYGVLCVLFSHVPIAALTVAQFRRFRQSDVKISLFCKKKIIKICQIEFYYFVCIRVHQLKRTAALAMEKITFKLKAEISSCFVLRSVISLFYNFTSPKKFTWIVNLEQNQFTAHAYQVPSPLSLVKQKLHLPHLFNNKFWLHWILDSLDSVFF